MTPRPFLLPAASLLAAALLAACGKAAPVEPEVRPVRTLVVAPAATSLMNTYTGEVRARYESTLGFRVPGKITARKVEAGSRVRRGQLLFTLDGQDLNLGAAAAAAQVQQAQAEFRAANLDLDRFKGLRLKGYVSESELNRQQARFDAAKAQVAAATAQSEQFENQTGYASLSADADGVVTAVLAEAGQVVAAGTPVARVARTGELEVLSSVPEDQINRVSEGMDVQVSLWSGSKERVAARVREVASAADGFTRTYPVRVSVPTLPAGMRLGMTASVHIPLATPPMIKVPASALVTNGKQAGLWLLQEKTMTVAFRPVVFAGADGNDALIGDGLAPGDEVVTAGAGLLTEGQKVKRLGAISATAAAPATPAAKAGE